MVQEWAQQIAAAEISKALDPYRAYLDRLEPAMGMVNWVVQQQDPATQQQASAQIEAAEAIFGKIDTWDSRHRSLVGTLANRENTDTGQKFTVAEAITGNGPASNRSAASGRGAAHCSQHGETLDRGPERLALAGGGQRHDLAGASARRDSLDAVIGWGFTTKRHSNGSNNFGSVGLALERDSRDHSARDFR